jgi:hypothetical protein
MRALRKSYGTIGESEVPKDSATTCNLSLGAACVFPLMSKEWGARQAKRAGPERWAGRPPSSAHALPPVSVESLLEFQLFRLLAWPPVSDFWFLFSAFLP